MKLIYPASLAIAMLFSACTKDPGAKPHNSNKANFIPAQGKKFEYNITMENGKSATATKWITGVKDSLGINVFNLRTELESEDGSMTMDNQIFDINGKTVTDLVMPDKWNDVIEMMEAQEGVDIIEASPAGFPAYMLLENAILQDKQLTFQGPATQGQYLKFTIDTGEEIITQEVTQKIVHNPGKVVAVETITTPAGTFVCSKWEYSMDDEQVVRVNGVLMSKTNNHDAMVMWTAHGIGVVKSISTSGEDVSTTVLEKIH